jgi:hypothetical protein
MAKLGIKAALRNLVEKSTVATSATYVNDADRQAVVDAFSVGLSALAVSEIRKLKKSTPAVAAPAPVAPAVAVTPAAQ